MSELSTKRTLVKSPPELWAEISDLEALARHLGEFGEIRITRLEPETTVVWEGDRVSGTVKLEPSGWGTKVTLTAELAAIEAAQPQAEREPEPQPEPTSAAPSPSTPQQRPAPTALNEHTAEPSPSPTRQTPAPAAALELSAPAVATPAPAPELSEPAIATPAPELSAPAPEPPPRALGFWARLFGRRPRLELTTEVPQPAAPVEEPAPDPEPVEDPAPLQPVPAPIPPPPEPSPAPESYPEPEPAAERHPDPAAEPEPATEPAAPSPAARIDDDRAVAVLTEVLDNLGAAHHRPFSRG